MKTLLHLKTGIVILIFSVLTSNGQTTVLAENFSGFTSGSHATPSTVDASSSLDLKTIIPGWAGNLVYPAGGEIKIGTGTSTGWIETPVIDLSSNNGNFSIRFDIARWTGDATTVQVYLNGIAAGSVITPTDDYQSIKIAGTTGTSSSKIKFQALMKRFYLDNITITSENLTTEIPGAGIADQTVLVYPIPACNRLIISNIQNMHVIDIHDVTGVLVKRIINDGGCEIDLDISGFTSGLYLVRLKTGNSVRVVKILKI